MMYPRAGNADGQSLPTFQGSQLLSSSTQASNASQRNAKLPFPCKVYEMLENVQKEGLCHIVSWLPHGKSFRVHVEEEFVTKIMPKYFNQSKFTSFTRQLYIYGFQKMPDGPDKGSFIHPKFIKDDKSLCMSMKRNKNNNKFLKKQPNNNPDQLCDEALRANMPDVRPIGGECQQHSRGLSCHPQVHRQDIPLPQPTRGGPSNLMNFLPTMDNSVPTPDPIRHMSLPTTMNNPLHHSSFPLPNLPTTTASTMQRSLMTTSNEGPVEEQEDWLAKFERLTSEATLPSSSSHSYVPSTAFASETLYSARYGLNTGNSSSNASRGHTGQWTAATTMQSSHLNQQTTQAIPNSAPLSLPPNGRNVLVGNNLTDGSAQQKIIPPQYSTLRFNNQPISNFDDVLRYQQSLSEPSKEQDLFNDDDGDHEDFAGIRFDFL